MIVSPAVCDLRHGLNGIQLIVVMVPQAIVAMGLI
jgi:hypothetical protein